MPSVQPCAVIVACAELFKTQQIFVRDMTILRDVFQKAMLDCGIVSAAQARMLFSNVDEV
jgi:hypothetical protein